MLTKRELEYIFKIKEYKRNYKGIPSVRTICKLVGVRSVTTVYDMLKKLKLKGFDYTEF